MKGPRARWKHDVRRVWECPACRRRERTDGDTVNLSCDCQMKSEPPRSTWMRLIEEEPKGPVAAPTGDAEPPSKIGPQQPSGDAGSAQ